MDVLSQALSVAEQAEHRGGRVAITFDLEDADQRAAFTAAVAVLHSLGVDPDTLLSSGVESGEADQAVDGPDAIPGEPVEEEEDEGQDSTLRRDFGAAIATLTPDTQRRAQIVQDTFPRVRELLRDGANVEAVAQIQYRRWLEEHLSSVHRNSSYSSTS